MPKASASVEYLPNQTEFDHNVIIGQILSREKFLSKSDALYGQKFDRERAEILIENNLRTIMIAAAKNDVINGIYGDAFVKKDDAVIEGFTREFLRGLKNERFKLYGNDEEADKALSKIYGTMQSLLLRNYETIVKDAEYSTAEDLEKALERLKSKTILWPEDLRIAVKNNKITPDFKDRLFLLLKAFEEHYVATVWETESALRSAMKTGVETKI